MLWSERRVTGLKAIYFSLVFSAWIPVELVTLLDMISKPLQGRKLLSVGQMVLS